MKLVKHDDETRELIRSVGMRLGRVGGRVEEGSGGNLMVVFTEDRDADEARRLVREQLDDCADDWSERVEV